MEMMERIVAPSNIRKAYQRVKRNDGRPGVDGMTVEERIRELTGRNRGRRVEQIIREVATYLQGWRQYFNYAYNKQTFRELTAWIKRRLRCYMWKQWGRAGYRELRKRGVSRNLAWNTCKSHHGPWRLSRSPALAYALTTRYFVDLGLPLLHVNV